MCTAKENSNSTKQSSSATPSAAEKNTQTKEKKTENQSKKENPAKNNNGSAEGTNQPESETKKDDAQKENSENKTVKSKSPVPKMNSILSEKSTDDNQKATNGNENEAKELSEVEFNLPEVKDEEVSASPNTPLPESNTEARSVPKTILAWILIVAGVAVILGAIILNLKMPHGMNLKYHEKHGIKSGKRKNKYRLKYK